MASDSCPQPAFAGVVLAGGHSRRFGEANKAVAALYGVTFIERVVDALHEVSDDTPVVVVDDNDQRTTVEAGLESGTDPRFTFDAPSFAGPLSGLYGALPLVDREWLFLAGCGMPCLDPGAVTWLATQARTTRPPPDALVPVDPDGGLEPLHGFYRRDAVAGARDQLRPDVGLRVLLDELSELATVEIPATPPGVPLGSSVENVNTRQEHQELQRTFERNCRY